MDALGAGAVLLAGVAAGTINTIVGSGSLISFPTLLAVGYSPLVANVSNTVGLVPGSLSGAIGYRRELRGQRSRAIPLSVAALFGGVTGAVLLLVLPASAFTRIVPVLILVACVLVALQPRLSRLLAERRARAAAQMARDHAAAGATPGAGRRSADGGPLLLATVYLNGIYGGYFGAAQGVILIALLAILIDDDLQRLNGLKNVLTVVVNGVAALLFIILAPVAWEAAALLAVGATAGGQLGALVGRRLSPLVLRGAIIVVGTAVAVRLLVS